MVLHAVCNESLPSPSRHLGCLYSRRRCVSVVRSSCHLLKVISLLHPLDTHFGGGPKRPTTRKKRSVGLDGSEKDPNVLFTRTHGHNGNCFNLILLDRLYGFRNGNHTRRISDCCWKVPHKDL